MKTLHTLNAQLPENPDTCTEYEAQAEAFGLAHALITACAHAGLTQAQVVEHMGTTQSTVAWLKGSRRISSPHSVNATPNPIGCQAVARRESTQRRTLREAPATASP